MKLDTKQHDRTAYEGMLPASAPLANPYVPYQRENPPKYEARKALVRGTMFPGLDLPFMGMVNQKPLPETPLSELQVLAFAMHDLALYLDTHRNDKEALVLYRQYQKIHHDATMAYAQQCGPMTHTEPVDQDCYSWLCDPWPWEYCKP